MRLIRQKGEIDCGTAVAAMVAGVPYWEAMACDPNLDSVKGFSLAELWDVLEELTDQRWRVINHRPYRPLSSYSPPQTKNALLIRLPKKQIGHFIAWDGKRIFDPELTKPFNLETYPRRTWNLIRSFTPR